MHWLLGVEAHKEKSLKVPKVQERRPAFVHWEMGTKEEKISNVEKANIASRTTTRARK